MIIKQCLTCGKEFKTFKCHTKDKKYCSINCYNVSKKGKPTWNKGKTILPFIKCLNCGKIVKNENRRRKFCSRHCFLVGPRKEKELVDRICQQCGNKFKVYPSVAKIKSGKFCSIKCRNLSIIGKEPINKKERFIQKCSICNKMFKTYITNNGKPHRQFCSRKCSDLITRLKEGKENSHWQGDNVGYYSLHSWVGKHLGKPNQCSFCGKIINNPYHIHWANIDHTYKRNLTDWIRLCCWCHKKYDLQHNLSHHN